MNNLKLIDLAGNLCLAISLVLGLLHLHWAVIFICAVAITIVRIAYIKAEQRLNVDTPNNAPPTPQMVRYVASFITSLLMAGIVYGIGYAIRYGINLML